MSFLRISLLSSIALFTSVAGRAIDVKLSGSTTTVDALIRPQQAAVEGLTGLSLKINASSTGQGLVDLAEGRCDVALVSEPIEIACEAAARAGSKLDPEAFSFHPISTDLVAFIVHPSNSVKTLSNDQLRSIHTGVFTNWKQVGGADLPIVVITNTPTGGTPALVRATIMQGDNYSPRCQQVSSIKLVSTRVSEIPGAIGATNASLADPAIVTVLKTSPLRRPLGFVTRQETSAAVERMLAGFRVSNARLVTSR